jgi:transcriptional regulator with XRE-family HTH domain
MPEKANFEWIKDGLAKRGYRQKDVAVAWGSQQASVSRFLNGEELQDPPISKARALAQMLGISIDDLAKGLGLAGPVIEPSVETLAPHSIPIGTFAMESPRPGVARIEMRKDFSAKAAQEILGIMAHDSLPS